MASSIAFDIYARDRASATFDKLGKKVEGSEAKFGSFAKKAAIAGAVVGAALVKFGASSVKAFEEAAKSQRQLTDAYARFPKLADVSIDSFRRQADAIQSKTGFDNDQINSTQALLGSYKLTGSQVQKLTPLIVDYAARTGKSLPDATKIAGKAILGQGRGLKDIGIAFKDTKTPIGNFNELMGALRTKVGGFADKEGKTASGRAEILKRKFEDFQESVGEKLVPVLEKLTSAGIKVLDWMDRNKTLVTVVAAVIGGALVVAIAAATVSWIALNLAFIATPIGAIITGFVLVVAALVIAYKKFETFRNIVNTVFDVVATAAKIWWAVNVKVLALVAAAFRKFAVFVFTVFVNPILRGFGILLHGAAVAFSWVPGLNHKLANARDAFDRFQHQVNGIIDKIRGKKTFVLDAHVTQATKNAFALYLNTPQSQVFTSYFKTVNLPGGTKAKYGATGGHPKAGEPWIIGEQGPELFIPDRPGRIVPNGQLKSGGGGMSAGAIAAAVADALSGAQFRFDGDGLATLVTKRQQAYAVRGGRR